MIKKYMSIFFITFMLMFNILGCSKKATIEIGTESNKEMNEITKLVNEISIGKEVYFRFNSSKSIGEKDIIFAAYKKDKDKPFDATGISINPKDTSVIIPFKINEAGEYRVEILAGDKKLAERNVKVVE